MNALKPINYTPWKKFIFDWTDKETCSFQGRVLKIYVRHGMIVDKTHELMSFQQR